MLDLLDWHQLLKFVHILGFVLWLGGDLGVYVAARYVANGALALDERMRFMELLMTLDMFPRAMLILMLPVGLQLGVNLALIAMPALLMPLIWLLALVWFILMWRSHGGSSGLLRNVDLAVRGAVMTLLAAVALLSLVYGWPVVAPWLALKMLLFSAVIALGLLLRGVVKRWMTGFSLQESDKATGDAIIVSAHHAGARYARLLWALLILMGLLGTLKPFY